MNDKLSEALSAFFDEFVVEDASSEIVVDMPEDVAIVHDEIEEDDED